MEMDDKVSGPGGVSQKNWTHTNSTSQLPLEMTFNHGHIVQISVYSVLMVVSATGNLTVLTQLVKRRRAGRASRLDLLLMHLAIADLMVTFLMMPLEIAWAGTVQWLAGDLMCRLMMFTRTFGLYLSSFVLICIAVDRYYAILKPLNVTWEANARRALHTAWVCAALASLPQSFIFHVEEHPDVAGYVNCALFRKYWKPLELMPEGSAVHTAWVCTALASLPQSLIFHVEEHPDVAGYFQCVSYGSLPTESHVFGYFLLNMLLMYLLPLVSTLYCSLAALLEIIRRANTSNDNMRRSGVGILGRARARTLKMTVTIVIVFFTCWSPYYCYCLWYWVDKEFVKGLDPAFQKAMWLFSCTNSCANPIVYGIFNRNRWSWRTGPHTRRRGSGARRGSRLPFGDSMEISASVLARARHSLHGRRDSYVTHNGHKHHNNNNKYVDNGIV